ncbi:E3 ubiquitin-protein ligase NEURL3 [Xenentodon cancila]
MKFFDLDNDPVRGPERPHVCSSCCLGPLAFHHQAVGEEIQLSQGCRYAERTGCTFRNGLVFSSRPVRVGERIHLKVLMNVLKWEGALRVGFTTVPPTARNLPLPSMAIPDLIKCPGHWAAPLPQSYCPAGSELEFWVSAGGSLYFADKNNRKSRKYQLLTGVDVSKPLWFMLDIYGRTGSIFLMGSRKKGQVCTKRSCPAPAPAPGTEPVTITSCHPSMEHDLSSLGFSAAGNDESSLLVEEVTCVTCLMREATVITLPCSHKCLCHRCFLRVLQEFGTCPLCRKEINSSSAVERRVSGTV